MALSDKEKKQLQRKRREAAREAQQYHKSQKKKAKKSSAKVRKPAESKPKKPSSSKIEEAVNSGNTAQFQKISREEKFRRESEERIRNLKPQDFEDGYYIDEYTEKKKSEKRAKIIRKQEREVIHRNKKPLTQKQIRLRRILISSGIFLVVLIIGVVLSLTVLFKTEKIEVEGCEVYYDDQITAFSNLTLQKNIFIAKMESTPEEIVRNLPYVEAADISVSIPDTVVIKITEALPAYVMRNQTGFLLISSKGRILEQTDANTYALPELKCGDVSTGAVGDYIQFSDVAVPDILENVANTIKENGIEKIIGFDVTNTSAITLNYDNRILINIGLAEDIDYKLKTANAIITRKLDPNGTAEICGVLDVSTCSKNKMSHYKPSDTKPQPDYVQPGATVPATTAPRGNIQNSENTDDEPYYYGGVYSDGTVTEDGEPQYNDGAEQGEPAEPVEDGGMNGGEIPEDGEYNEADTGEYGGGEAVEESYVWTPEQ